MLIFSMQQHWRTTRQFRSTPPLVMVWEPGNKRSLHEGGGSEAVVLGTYLESCS